MRQLFAGSFCQRTSSSMRTTFFTPDGRLTDPLFAERKIYAELECCAAKRSAHHFQYCGDP